ncbi:DUF86 domain-containing protein [Aeribacillus pallidus]|nr:HepT-like ribonuclease domain-containing protein [Aeribacillus pallidus]
MEKDGWHERYEIHGYFSINYRIVWDVVQNKIPKLKQHVEQLLSDF